MIFLEFDTKRILHYKGVLFSANMLFVGFDVWAEVSWGRNMLFKHLLIDNMPDFSAP